MWLFNAYDPKYISRIELPILNDECSDCLNDKFKLVQTYISYDNNLYFITIDREACKYKVWAIDLDRSGTIEEQRRQKYKVKPLFTYSFENVNHEPPIDMLVRSDYNKTY